MNFLEAFDELDELNEASDHYRIPPRIKFSQVGGKCPAKGCIHEFDNKREYEQHITDGCNKVKNMLAKMPARIKVGKAGHSYDELTNITEEDMLKYLSEHSACEICGKTGDIHPDHKHANDGSHTGTFRGVLCNQCNLLLGQLERRIGSNSLPCEEYLTNILRYLNRGEKWVTNAPFTAPNEYFDIELDYELRQDTSELNN
jgi:hypothetical protein